MSSFNPHGFPMRQLVLPQFVEEKGPAKVGSVTWLHNLAPLDFIHMYFVMTVPGDHHWQTQLL